MAVDGARAPGRRTGGVQRFQVQVPGTDGKNKIEARGTDRRGGESASAFAEYRFSARETPPASLYLVAVGIDTYPDPPGALRFAAKDAQDLASTLEDQGSGVFGNRMDLKVLNNPATTTRAAVEQAVAKVALEARPQDVFIFYLAGHGETVTSGYHFITAENPGGGLDNARIVELLTSVKTQKSLLILDTCYAGALMNEKDGISPLAHNVGGSVLAASGPKQWAMEGYNGHGVFSYFLIEGLRGHADRANGNRDDKITLGELNQYLMEQVPLATADRWGRRQQPRRILQGDDFPLTVARR